MTKFELWLKKLLGALIIMVACLFYTAALVTLVLVCEAVLPAGGTLVALILMLVGTASFLKVEYV